MTLLPEQGATLALMYSAEWVLPNDQRAKDTCRELSRLGYLDSRLVVVMTSGALSFDVMYCINARGRMELMSGINAQGPQAAAEAIQKLAKGE
jgi:hypothetical protein